MRISNLVFLVTLASTAQGASTDPKLMRPLLFEPGSHQGEYLSWGGRTSLSLSRAGIEFRPDNVRLALMGGLPADPEGTDIQTSVSNYFLGTDSSRWRTGVANYGKVRYAAVYPGVDLLVYGSERSFEYDFVLAPHADASRIRMRFDGTKDVRLNATGDLLIGEDGLMQRHPRVFQEGREIAGSFRIERDRSVSFDLGAYDHSLPLTIDPVITYATLLGGSSLDTADAVATDKQGNVFVAGTTASPNFPGQSIFGTLPSGTGFAFVSKYAPVSNGKTQLVFTIFLGSNVSYTIPGGTIVPGRAFALAVTTDFAGNIIVGGQTDSPSFPTMNPVQAQLGGTLDCGGSDNSGRTFQIHCFDAFLSKFTPDGRTLIFSTYYGGPNDNSFQRLATDAAGGIYVAGTATGPTSLQGTSNAIQVTAKAQDVHLVRFDASGKVVYATYLGGIGTETLGGLAVEKPGVVWIGGQTSSTDFPLTQNVFLSTFNATVNSAYIARIDMSQVGAAGLTYSSYFHGALSNGQPFGNTNLGQIFIDPSGQVVFCGSTAGILSPTPTAMQSVPPLFPSSITSKSFADGDGYIARLNPALTGTSAMTYLSYVGGTSVDSVVSCALDPKGNFLVVGNTESIRFFGAGSPFPYKGIGGVSNVFAIRFDPAKTGFPTTDTIEFGGDAGDQLTAMAVDSNGLAYLVGYTGSSRFPVTSGAIQKNYAGGADGWLSQLDLNLTQMPVAGIAVDQGDFQFAAPGSSLNVSVHIADAQGNHLRLAGYPVIFTATGSTVPSGIVLTNGDGVAAVTVQLGSGDATVTATLNSDPPVPAYVFHLKAITGTLPKSVAIVSGSGQGGKAGSPLALPLVVELRDGNNAALPIAGITVSFKATNASVNATNVLTDAQGRASTQVTLGTQAVAPSVAISAGNLPVVTATFALSSSLISAAGVVNAATYLNGGVSPGLIVTFFGLNVGPGSLTVASAGPDNKFPVVLGQTRVLFDGLAAPLIYVSSGQTSAIVPYTVTGGTTQAVIEYQGVASNSVTLPVVPSQPGLFSSNSSGKGQGAILNEDNSVNGSTNPIKRRHIVVLFGTGEGFTDPAGVDGQVALSVYPKPRLPVNVKINGIDAEVLYAGAAPTLVAGVLQVNVRIPAGVPDGDATVQVFVGSASSPATVTVAVKGD